MESRPTGNIRAKKFHNPIWKTVGMSSKIYWSHSSMDRISDSGSDDLGSNPGGITWSIWLYRGMICLHTSVVLFNSLVMTLNNHIIFK